MIVAPQTTPRVGFLGQWSQAASQFESAPRVNRRRTQDRKQRTQTPIDSQHGRKDALYPLSVEIIAYDHD